MTTAVDWAPDHGAAAYDEMHDGSGVRPEYHALRASLDVLDGSDLRTRIDTLAASYLDQGVTFDIGGEERAFPIDILPRIIAADDWRRIELGVQQRVRALEAFLADAYGLGQVFADGVVPRSAVVSSGAFHREAAGIVPVNGVRCHVAGIDLIRDEQGRFLVL
jgi:uncharacterized circularly permuted ATP-grasp superfamily protein